MHKDLANIDKHLDKAILWIRGNQERFWAITGAVLLSVLLVGLIMHHRQTESDDAWFQLGAVHGQLMQGKLDDARKGLDSWQARFANSDAATYAQFMKADLLYRSTDYVQASQIYATLAQSGGPDAVKPLALSAQADSEEMAGHYPQAQALDQMFLDRYPDHFLAATRYLSQARLAELTGNAPAASAIYERFVLLFPQSPWTAMAKARLQMLGKAAPLPSMTSK